MNLPTNNRINQKRYKFRKRITLAHLRVKARKVAELERAMRLKDTPND